MNKNFNDVLIVNKKHSSKRSVGLVILSSSGVPNIIRESSIMFNKMSTQKQSRTKMTRAFNYIDGFH
jgi:hypothetical protein